MTEIDRLARIAGRAAKRLGAVAACYASGRSFDVLTERYRTVNKLDGTMEKVYDGMAWIKSDMRAAYVSPALVARNIRNSMARLWA